MEVDGKDIDLICLVDGDPVENVFLVRIREDRYILELKEEIKAKNENTLKSIDAKDLNLWLVSIPFDDTVLAGLKLENNAEKGIKMLGPIDRFPKNPVYGRIHIIVQLPVTG
jgi:Crinkler effector protein N-terminal domain